MRKSARAAHGSAFRRLAYATHAQSISRFFLVVVFQYNSPRRAESAPKLKKCSPAVPPLRLYECGNYVNKAKAKNFKCKIWAKILKLFIFCLCGQNDTTDRNNNIIHLQAIEITSFLPCNRLHYNKLFALQLTVAKNKLIALRPAETYWLLNDTRSAAT